MGKIFFGQVGKLKQDKIEEYEVLHANTWPSVRKMITECNIINYSIFRQDQLVFSYFEYIGEDYDADMAKMAANPETQRWWTYTHPCFETYSFGDAEFYADMKQIFYNE